VEVSEHNSNI